MATRGHFFGGKLSKIGFFYIIWPNLTNFEFFGKLNNFGRHRGVYVDLKLDFAKIYQNFGWKKAFFYVLAAKFDQIWQFFCIIKHFHPPSWRLSGPETGFCKKNIKNLAEKKPFLIFLSKFPEKKPGFWLNFRQYLTKFGNIWHFFV